MHSHLSPWLWLIALPLVALLQACGPADAPQLEISGNTMGTSYSIKIIGAEQLDLDQLKLDLDRRLDGINTIMSTYDPNSMLSRFNQHEGTDWYSVPYTLALVIKTARRISLDSGGAFDITVGPLVDLWGFGPDGPRTSEPPADEWQSARELVGFKKLEVTGDPAALRKSVPGLRADLSAIAKGFGVDQMAALLESRGIERYLVEIGGEVRVRGLNAKNKPWRLGIEKPDAAGRQVQQAVDLKLGALATSGDYRNFFESGGQRYSHTIDPDTGRPVAHSLASATVFASDCMTADGWATALMALGPEKGRALAEKLGLAAYFIVRTEDGFETSASPEFQRLLSASH